ncbi:MAG TPA: amidohydrolase family protein [Thermoanaerobaculia bacterium]|nr:amidohydrolase family protein [Thermoanaerobaculia bacterium]
MRILATLLTVLVLGCGTSPQHDPTASEGGAVAFVGANVVPMDREGVLRDHTVVVRGDRIESIAPASSASIPAGARQIDASGSFLLPGLAEMHGHIPPPTASPELIEDTLFLYVAAGVTTVRGMLGAPGQLDLKERAARGEIVAPNLYLAGPSFSGNSISSPEEAIEKVRLQKSEGWDLLKVHPGLTRAEYDAMARTANELGMRFGGHVPAEVGLVHAIEMGQETFDHVDGYVEHLGPPDAALDEGKLAAIVEKTRSAGAWIVPTMALWETLLGSADPEKLASYSELRYMPRATVESWKEAHRRRLASPSADPRLARRIVENRTRILRALHEGGVPILMGTDAPQQFSVPGFSIHRELPRMEAAGMSPWEILATGTRNVGRYFADHDRFGTVAAGERADLILVGGNPLEALGNLEDLEGVMVGGRWLGREQIDARLAAIAARRAAE